VGVADAERVTVELAVKLAGGIELAAAFELGVLLGSVTTPGVPVDDAEGSVGGWKWIVVSSLMVTLNGSSKSEVHPVGNNTKTVISTEVISASVMAKVEKVRKATRHETATEDGLELNANKGNPTVTKLRANNRKQRVACWALESSVNEGFGVGFPW